MSVTAVVGANWGDEGKGRMVDALCGEHDVVVRYQGGGNAGHTVITDQGKFVLHLLPSGVLRPGKVNVLGPGVALDAVLLGRELRGLAERGVAAPKLLVSSRAQLLMQHHRRLDTYEEERLGDKSFGSTQSGIAPFYSDKFAKLGVRVDDLFDSERLRQRITPIISTKNILCKSMYNSPAFELDHVLAELGRARELLEPLACDTTDFLHDALESGQRVLVEGQLGALRDPDHGIYPWVTSSSPLAGFACVGAGLPPSSLTRVVAVTKAYSSAVGAGPFVTELSGDEASELRERGGDAGEYGATTGPPRRVGWFDALATRYGCRVQGATEVALTGLDVLGYLDRLSICTAYRIGDELQERFPPTRELEQATPHYELMEGWRRPLGDIKRFDELPAQARAYVLRLEALIEVPIRWVSFGPHREQLLERK